jgi:hypothetical protein
MSIAKAAEVKCYNAITVEDRRHRLISIPGSPRGAERKFLMTHQVVPATSGRPQSAQGRGAVPRSLHRRQERHSLRPF